MDRTDIWNRCAGVVCMFALCAATVPFGSSPAEAQGSPHDATGKTDGPWACVKTDNSVQVPCSAGQRYTFYQSPDPRHPTPSAFNPGGWGGVDVYADGVWALFGLEIQDKETNPYAAGNPQEGYNNREVNSLINFDASPGWVATLASFMTKAPTTWSKKEAYFKDYNSKGVVALNIGNGCPWVPLTYKADGSAVQAVDKIADFDQPWYSVVGGVAKPMGGKVKAHHVTLLYKYVVRNIGGLAYPETPPG